MIARWQRHWHEVWDSLTESTQTAAIAAAITLLLALLLWPLVQFWGLPRLRQWRVERTMTQAAAFHADGDYRNLLLSIRRASQLGSRDLDVWRNIAGYMTQLGSPEALSARQTVSRLAPDDLSAKIELAQTALLFGEYKISQDALQAAAAVADSDPAYQEAAATLALYLGDVSALKQNLALLVATQPANLDAAFDLATAQLWSRDSTERHAGIATLIQLLDQPDRRVQAALELLKDAARSQDAAQFETVLPTLIAALDYPATSTLTGQDLNRLLLGLKTTAAAHPADVARVASWMADIRHGRDALQWIHRLPPAIAESPAVLPIAAEIALRDNLTEATSFYLLRNALGELPPQAAVLIAGARALEDNNRVAAAQAAWDEALKIAQAARHPAALQVLARVATLWDHPDWAERALQAAIERSPDAFWAYAALRDLLLQRDDPNELWSLYQKWIQRQPDDLTVVVQWLRLGLTLPYADPEVRRRAPGLLAALPHSPRLDAARAGLAWWEGDLAAAEAHLARAGDAVYDQPDAAYWAALIRQPAQPNTAYPALALLRLASPERERLTADPDTPAGLVAAPRLHTTPSLRVR